VTEPASREDYGAVEDRLRDVDAALRRIEAPLVDEAAFRTMTSARLREMRGPAWPWIAAGFTVLGFTLAKCT
jgi:hypothetical protein